MGFLFNGCNLNFNKELLELDKKLGDYVIVHELLHFKVPNHGKLWKSLMNAYLGDYQKLEKKLKEIATGQYYVLTFYVYSIYFLRIPHDNSWHLV